MPHLVPPSGQSWGPDTATPQQRCSTPRPALKCHPMRRAFMLQWPLRHPSLAGGARLAANGVCLVVNLEFPSTTGLKNNTKGLENFRPGVQPRFSGPASQKASLILTKPRLPICTGTGLRGLVTSEPSTVRCFGAPAGPSIREPHLGRSWSISSSVPSERQSKAPEVLTGKLNRSAIPLASRMPAYKR